MTKINVEKNPFSIRTIHKSMKKLQFDPFFFLLLHFNLNRNFICLHFNF